MQAGSHLQPPWTPNQSFYPHEPGDLQSQGQNLVQPYCSPAHALLRANGRFAIHIFELKVWQAPLIACISGQMAHFHTQIASMSVNYTHTQNSNQVRETWLHIKEAYFISSFEKEII